MNMKIDDQIKEIIKDSYNMHHGESCGSNYYGVKEWTCRCGTEGYLKEDTESIRKLFVSIIGECLPVISICSAHREYDKTCEVCNVYEKEQVYRQYFLNNLREKGLEVGRE